MEVIGGFKPLKFDMDRFLKDFEAAIQNLMISAARAWLRAVLTKVPVWTGESRGSLQPIGRFIKIAVPATPSRTAPADRQARGQTRQDFAFTKVGSVYLMHWETRVAHYLLNEYQKSDRPLLNPTPWHSLEVGEQAWTAYMLQNMVGAVPNPSQYFKKA